jgi:hypothetical protein
MNFLRRQWIAKKAVLGSAREVRARTGRSVLSQFREMLRLRLGPGKLRSMDYYVYGVYDDARFSPAGKREVLSWSPQVIADRLNDPTWRAICNDKLVCYGVLKGLEVPFPPIYAIFDPHGRTFGTVPALATPAAAADFLRDGMHYPFFAKTISGGYGRGASSVVRLERERDHLVFRTGEEVEVEQYVNQYVAPARDGYLFQEPVRQHPLIERISGGRVGTLRMVVLRGDDGPRLFRAIWRVPVGGNITDNFLHGTQGNLVAHVDRETGRVRSVVQATSYEPDSASGGRRLGRQIESHPDTGERLVGVTLPNWQVIVSTCLHGAAALPGLRYQSWDVAIGPEGPVILELNYRGGIDITQIPGTAGFFDAEFREFWARYAG